MPYRKRLPAICVGVCGMCLNIASSPVWPLVPRLAAGIEAVQAERDSGLAKETFKPTLLGEGRAKDGTLLAHTIYATSRGAKVLVTHGRFDSADGAKVEFHIWLKTVKQIIEQGIKTRPAAEPVGERAVVRFESEPQIEDVAILWTDGRDCYWVASASLSLNLEVERRLDATKEARRDRK